MASRESCYPSPPNQGSLMGRPLFYMIAVCFVLTCVAAVIITNH